jgi:stage V sporulation protein AE
MQIFLQFLWVFLIGGGICMLGQLLILRTNITPSRILTLFVAVGVLLGALQLFAPIKKFASSGITVPIVGFGGALADGAIKAVKKDGFLGIFTGGLAATAAGIAVAVTMALVIALIFKSRQKV